MDIPAVVKESSRLPGPYDNPGPALSMEKGRVIDNYTIGIQGIPICMGNGTHNLSGMASHSQYFVRFS